MSEPISYEALADSMAEMALRATVPDAIWDLSEAAAALRQAAQDREAIHDAVSAAATDMWDEHVEPLQDRLEVLERVVEKAKALWGFEENERGGAEPPLSLIEKGYATVLTNDEYNKEEELVDALGETLATLEARIEEETDE